MCIRDRSDKALTHAGTIMPGYTHLQRAQPITFGHHLLAYAEMFLRDIGRLDDAAARMNVSPLGSSALASTCLLYTSKCWIITARDSR